MITVAALFVAANGPYFGLENVEPWDVVRDARGYSGPHRVVAHPPCERWGRYWGGGPSVKVPRKLGDDNGCFAAALTAVRTYGGVLEHPEASHAWTHFGLNKPPKSGGWIRADDVGGWTCCVEQGHYGHKARKATWLYAFRTVLPSLIWGPSDGMRMEDGFHSTQERAIARAAGVSPVKRLSPVERVHTPQAFRDTLIAMARAPAVPADFIRQLSSHVSINRPTPSPR